MAPVYTSIWATKRQVVAWAAKRTRQLKRIAPDDAPGAHTYRARGLAARDKKPHCQ